jgi:DNA (cytosine-5)-methyltransferase 1
MQALRAEGRAPRTIVIENVCGLLTSHRGEDFDSICNALGACGYRFGALVIDAALFVPQSRERVFVVAVDADAPIPSELVAEGPMAPFHPPTLAAACKRQRDPLWFKLPTPPRRNVDLIDMLEPDGSVRWRSTAETAAIIATLSPASQVELERRAATGARSVGALSRRTRENGPQWEARFDGLAGCLRTASGGSSRQSLLFVEGDRVRSRLLSPREAARLMGLPDDYQLPSNYNDAYGLMGDGVVVPVVRHLAEHVLEPLLRAADSIKRIAACVDVS